MTSYTGNLTVPPDGDQGWPTVFPWPGQPLPAGHPLKRLDQGQTLRQRSFWTTPWGKRDEFYVDAIGYKTAIVAIFSAHDLWTVESFHAPVARDFDQRPELTVRCCGETCQVRGWPCSRFHPSRAAQRLDRPSTPCGIQIVLIKMDDRA